PGKTIGQTGRAKRARVSEMKHAPLETTSARIARPASQFWSESDDACPNASQPSPALDAGARAGSRATSTRRARPGFRRALGGEAAARLADLGRSPPKPPRPPPWRQEKSRGL